jgi:hypothetical protein
MIRQRILRPVAAMAAVIGMAGGLGALATGTGVAATQVTTHAASSAAVSTLAARPDYEITVHTTSAGDWFFPSSGGGGKYLPANDTVDVTCYYNGSTSYGGDHELDHVTYTQKYGNVPGHIPDYYVNFGGYEASQVGVPYC